MLAAAGCGAGSKQDVATGPAPIPTPIGRGPAFLPPAVGSGPAPSLPCRPGRLDGRLRAHLELFARRRVIIVPTGVGVGRGCRYGLRTLAPTGVIDFDRPGLVLRDFFDVWRMPLSRTRLLGFRGAVRAYVAGRRWHGDVDEIPLRDRGQIVVEVGGYVRPHSFYLFPPR
jgi:hypothetical protein